MDSVRKDSVLPPFDSSKLKEIASGKTKTLFEIPDAPSKVLVRSKDKITAFNAERQNVFEGKSSLSNVTTSRVFQYLESIGLKTHFIEQYSDKEFIADRCAMIPIEWVARRVATGSFLKRNPGVQEGYRWHKPKMELFFKDDAAGDPEWTEEMLIASGIMANGVRIGAEEASLMSRVTIFVFEVLERAWATLGCSLIDMKIEFGVNTEGDIVLADVIDNDSWRVWPMGDRRLQVDKQYYRDLKQVTPEEMAKLKNKYEWVAEEVKKFITPPKGRVAVLMGSPSDEKHGKEIRDACHSFGIPTFIRVTSAHKTPSHSLQVIAEYEADMIPTVFIAVAGRSNGLGPVSSGATPYPIINCPPISADWGAQDIWSSLRMPSGLGCTTVIGTQNAASAAASILGLMDHMVWGRVRLQKLLSFIKLAKADEKLQIECSEKNELLRQSLSIPLLEEEDNKMGVVVNGDTGSHEENEEEMLVSTAD